MATEICGKPFPGTLAAMTHCEHYYDESGPCCWCGSDEDEGDHPSCPAVAARHDLRKEATVNAFRAAVGSLPEASV